MCIAIGVSANTQCTAGYFIRRLNRAIAYARFFL